MNIELTKEAKNSDAQMLFSEDTQQITMSINKAAMSHIINRLTDLYADPLAATVREIVSNAIDATMKLPENERRAIDIKLPITLRKDFIVSDHGTGMSYETVINIYSQYGASTKDKDMSQIGAYGLGAKAPLSYCSQFVVQTIKDGELTEFLISKEEGANVVRIMRHETTDESNGTTVRVPIDEKDFEKVAELVHKYKIFSFNIPIKTIGGSDIETFSKYEQLIKFGELPVGVSQGKEIKLNLYISKSSFNVHSIENYLRQSFNFCYYGTLSGWKYKLKSNYYGNVNIYADLVPGLVDFSSSRDEITVNERLNKLVDLLNANVPAILLKYATNLNILNQMPYIDKVRLVHDVHNWNNNVVSNEIPQEYVDKINQLKTPKNKYIIDCLYNTDKYKVLRFALEYSDWAAKRSSSMHRLVTVVEDGDDPKKGHPVVVYSSDDVVLTKFRKQLEDYPDLMMVSPYELMLGNSSTSKVLLVYGLPQDDKKEINKVITKRKAYFSKTGMGNHDAIVTATRLSKDEIKQILSELFTEDEINNNWIFVDYSEYAKAVKPARHSTAKGSAFHFVTYHQNQLNLKSNSVYTSLLKLDDYSHEWNPNLINGEKVNIAIIISEKGSNSNNYQKVLDTWGFIIKMARLKDLSPDDFNIITFDSKKLLLRDEVIFDDFDYILFFDEMASIHSSVLTEHLKKYAVHAGQYSNILRVPSQFLPESAMAIFMKHEFSTEELVSMKTLFPDRAHEISSCMEQAQEKYRSTWLSTNNRLILQAFLAHVVDPENVKFYSLFKMMNKIMNIYKYTDLKGYVDIINDSRKKKHSIFTDMLRERLNTYLKNMFN